MKLYEFGHTRSARCRWTLLELGVDFDSVELHPLEEKEAIRLVHPLAKLPALENGGRHLFESAAICNFLADRYPDKGLIANPGTWERAEHDQWTFFALTEMEAYLWSSAKHTRFYPEDKRVPQILPRNSDEFAAAAEVLDATLAERDFLVGGSFSVTDIIVGYTVSWGERAGELGPFQHLGAYLDRLCERRHCTLVRAS